MAAIKTTARKTRKQDASKKTAGTAKRFTAKSPSVEKTGYRFCRLGKAGKILAATRETFTLDEAEKIGNEFGLDILASRSSHPAGARIMHLHKPILDRLQLMRTKPPKMTKEQRADFEASKIPELDHEDWLTDVNLGIKLYLVVVGGNWVVDVTPDKRRAVHGLWMYRGDGYKAELWEKTVSLVNEVGPVEFWHMYDGVVNHSYENPFAAAAICEVGGSVDAGVFRVTKCNLPDPAGTH